MISARRNNGKRTQRKKPSGIRVRPSLDLTELVLRACLVANDAASNTREFLANASRMALLAVRDCEKELDQIEREIDEQLPAAITQVSEPEARELLACLRFSTDLERIGDLLWGVTQRAQELRLRLGPLEPQQLIEMAGILEKMLQKVGEGFSRRDLEPASYVLRTDRQMDQVYRSLFRRYFDAAGKREPQQDADILLMAQALERAGDHATNLAEELFHLIEGRSLRHLPKKQLHD
jgi:phosphate transport system protein